MKSYKRVFFNHLAAARLNCKFGNSRIYLLCEIAKFGVFKHTGSRGYVEHKQFKYQPVFGHLLTVKNEILDHR
jgi:hypothetical protein